MNNEVREAEIEYLVARRVEMTQRPRLLQRDADTAREFQARPYREELSKLSSSELSALVAQEKTKEFTELRAEAEREERERFFNQPHAKADFEYWAKMAHWKLDEAIALSFGKAPEYVKWKNVQPYVLVSPFAGEYNRRRELAFRAVPSKQLFDPVLPSIFLEWGRKLGLSIPAELEQAVAAVALQMADWKALYDSLLTTFKDLERSFTENNEKWAALAKEQQARIGMLLGEVQRLKTPTAGEKSNSITAHDRALGTREREGLLKMIAGMAKVGYRYDPKANRSTVTSEIASDLAQAGVPLDADTVRKRLRDAAELLPPDETKQSG
jgi:hypothetical protein